MNTIQNALDDVVGNICRHALGSGAYSLAGACDFNGIAASKCRTFYTWADRMEHTADEARADLPLIYVPRIQCSAGQRSVDEMFRGLVFRGSMFRGSMSRRFNVSLTECPADYFPLVNVLRIPYSTDLFCG